MDRWQTGDCGAYAVALRQMFPDTHYGVLGYFDGEFFVPKHHFTHDDEFAYDSLGKHALPYHGVNGMMDSEYGEEEWYYDEPHPEDVADAMSHILLTHCV